MKFRVGDIIFSAETLKAAGTIKKVSQINYIIYWHKSMLTYTNSKEFIEKGFFIKREDPNEILKEIL